MSVEATYPTDYDGDLELDEFIKHNWKSRASRDKWQGDLRACRSAFDVLEIHAVGNDELDCSVAQIDRAYLRKERCVELIRDLGLEIYTDHNKAFISTDKVDAEYVSNAFSEEGDSEVDEKIAGELLGYPDCCIDAFVDQERDDREVPLYEIACRSDNAVARDEENQEILIEDPAPVMNIMWQYLGFTFLPHRPCSFDCEHSIHIGHEYGSMFRDEDLGEEAENLWEFLGTPTTWSGLHGMANIRNGYLIGSTNTPPYWDEKIVVFGGDHSDKLL